MSEKPIISVLMGVYYRAAETALLNDLAEIDIISRIYKQRFET